MNAALAKPGRAALGRADLLRAYAEGGDRALAAMATTLGYQRRSPEPPPERDRDSEDSRPGADRGFGPDRTVVVPRPSARFFRATRRDPIQIDDARGRSGAPLWLEQAVPLLRDERAQPGSVRRPARLPLVSWSRLWPFLHRALGHVGRSNRIDVPRLVARAARGEVLRHLPYRDQRRWSPQISVLVDYGACMVPFWDDFSELTASLQRLHGRMGLDVQILAGEPGQRIETRRPGEGSVRPWRAPKPGIPLLLLGDLGQLGAPPEYIQGWRRFGARLRAAGCKALALVPVPAALQDPVLLRVFELREWDRGSRFRTLAPPSWVERGRVSPDAEALLTLASPAVVVEPGLLRHLRHLLPARSAGAASEAKAWLHPDMVRSTQGLSFGSGDAAEKYQRRFRELCPRLQRRAVETILAHHAHFPDSIRYAEMDACDRLCEGGIPEDLRRQVLAWKRGLVKVCSGPFVPAALADWGQRHLHRQTPMLWQDNPELAALWALAQRDRVEAGESLAFPPHVTDDQVRYFLDRDAEPRSCKLLQQGMFLTADVGDEPAAGSPLTNFKLSRSAITVRSRLVDHPAGPLVRVPLETLPWLVAELVPELSELELNTGSELLIVEAAPKRAPAMGRDRNGLFAEADWLGRRERLVWVPPEPGQPGYWRGDGALGYDGYGLYADLVFKGITQRFRWIAPGRFLMGSPEAEPERLKNETRHEVTLTRGYWLADSACTQGLWQAVSGENPSRFKGDPELPVEYVSWNDVQGFLAGLNEQIPDLNARLPSEAEWEYSCRAGTDTPFSFGGNITPDQVNYDGSHPYAGGAKGLNREKTLPVKSLPPNPWGLYEMHGNVWEWCADRYGPYAVEPVVDPEGPTEGADRVLRGGSWIRNGGDARSAFRDRGGPGDRGGDFGFRLALGHTGSGGPAEPGYQERPGRTAAAERGGQDGPGPRSRRKGR